VFGLDRRTGKPANQRRWAEGNKAVQEAGPASDRSQTGAKPLIFTYKNKQTNKQIKKSRHGAARKQARTGTQTQ